MALQTYSAGPYATWADPSGSYSVEYSQPLLFEVEYLVSEGYRRIPHGGIEIGGLLYGRIDGSKTRVQEFRLIDCEHASGPSFVLSERDLTKLRQQIGTENKSSEPELAELQIVGWFVAHTRSELRVSDGEAKIFGDLFPQVGQLTLLIKPEKFKATRFTFLRRNGAGEVQRDGEASTFILPLSGRGAGETGDGDEGVGSREPRANEDGAERRPSPVTTSAPPAENRDRTAGVPRERGSREPLSRPQNETSKEERADPAVSGAPTEIPRAPAPSSPSREPAPSSTQVARSNIAPFPAPSEQLVPASSNAYPEVADYQLPRRRRARPRYFDELERTPAPAGTRGPSQPSGLQFTVILLLAAALGCAVGYWAYLQLPSPVIALSVKAMPSAMLITWPSEQTREAVYAAIRVDDGPPVLLSSEDRNSGTTTVAGSPDSVKVELIIRHWLRDSRGIVRYLRGTGTPRPGQQGAVNGAALRSRNHGSPSSVPLR